LKIFITFKEDYYEKWLNQILSSYCSFISINYCSKEIEPEIRYDLKVLATPTEGRTVTLNQLVKERRLFQKCRFFSSII